MSSDLLDVRASLPKLSLPSDIEKTSIDHAPFQNSEHEAESALSLTLDLPTPHAPHGRSRSREERLSEPPSTRRRNKEFEEVLAVGWVWPKSSLNAAEGGSIPEVLNTLEKRGNPCLRLPAAVSAIAMCGDFVVLGLYDGGVVAAPLGASQSATLLSSFHPHKKQITLLKTIPNDRQFVSVSLDTTMKLWDILTRSEVTTFFGHLDRITTVVVTPDARYVVSAGKDKKIKVWNLKSQGETANFLSHSEPVTCLCPTSDSQTLVSGSEDMTVKLWDMADLQEITSLAGHTSAVESVTILPGDDCCLSVAYRTITMWSLKDMCAIRTLKNSNTITGLVAMGSGSLIFSSGDSLKMWTMEDTPPVVVAKFDEVVSGLADLENQDYVLVNLPKGIVLWSGSEKCEVANLVEYGDSAEDHLYYPTVTRDGRKIVYETNMNLKMWTLAQRKGRETREMTTAASSGKIILTEGDLGHVKTFNFETHELQVSSTGHSTPIEGVLIDQHSKYCLSWSEQESKLWKLDNLHEVSTHSIIFEDVKTIAVTSDEKYCFILVLQFGEKGAWLVWKLGESPEVTTLREVSINASMVLSADSKFCVLRTRNEIVVFNVEMQNQVTLPAEEGVRSVLSVTPDSTLIIVGLWDAVQLLNSESLTEEQTLRGHKGAVTCVAATPDSMRIITGSDDNTLKLWDLDSGCEVCTLVGHRTAIDCVAITTGGDYCLSVDIDSIHVWSLRDLREVTTIQRAVIIIDSVTLTSDYRHCLAWSSSWSNSQYSCQVDLFPISLPCSQSLPHPEPTPDELISNIPHFRAGNLRSTRLAGESFDSWRFNSLHISAFYNRFDRCKDYLRAGVPIIRGKFGSPLTVALSRKTIKCTDAILDYFIDSAFKVHSDVCWQKFESLTDDLPELLKSSSEKLPQFCNAVIQPSGQLPVLPQFLTPKCELPIVTHIDSRNIATTDFEKAGQNEEIVEFLMSVFRWNLTSGSEESIAMLGSFLECGNSEVLLSRYASLIIDEKWKKFQTVTTGIVGAYGFLICLLVAIVVRLCDLLLLHSAFLAVNGAFLAFEFVKMCAFGNRYAHECWNLLEIARIAVCVYWSTSSVISVIDVNPQVSFAVIVLCFIRGFTYFGYFSTTRIFLEIGSSFLSEISYLCGIVAYALSAFALHRLISTGDKSVSVVSVVDSNSFEWGLMTVIGGAVGIVLVSLSLTVLGEMYEKARVLKPQNDQYERVKLVIGYEKTMFWRRQSGQPTIIAVCESGNQTASSNWQGRSQYITMKNSVEIKSQLRANMTESEDRMEGFRGEVGGKLQAVEERVGGMEEKLEQLEEKVGGVEEILKEKMGEMEGKISDIQKKLEAVLSAVQRK